MKIRDPWIAKEKFKSISMIKNKLSHEKWIEFIEANQDYFTWYENTKEGIYELNHLDQIPEAFKEQSIRLLNKRKAFAEYNSKKGFHEIIIDFNEVHGLIGTTFQKRIRKEHLQMLLNMANYLDAYLLNGGNKIIDVKFIEEFENK